MKEPSFIILNSLPEKAGSVPFFLVIKNSSSVNKFLHSSSDFIIFLIVYF
jgi:hypothetical protein